MALTGFGLLRWPTETPEPPHSQAIVVGDGSATQKAMTGLTPATTYVFKMRACNGPNRCSDWTANQTFTTLAGTVTPGRVTNLRHSSSGDNSVTLAWNAPGNSAAAAVTGYHVQHRPLESDWPGDGVDVVQGAGTTTFSVSQLVDGTIYEFQVQACNAAGCGAWTDLLHPDHVIVAGHKVGNASLILASTDLAVGGRLGVGIHDIPKGKVAYAQMYGAIQPAGQCSTTRSTRSVARAPSASTGSGYYDTVNIEGCTPGGIGWLRVVNAAETELYARATITVGVPPGKVSQPTVAARNAGLYVQWTAPSAGSEPISHYDLQYREGTSGDWTLVEDIELTSYTITGLTNGTSYEVQVRAVSEVGGGAWSETATGTPSAGALSVSPSPGPGTTPRPIAGCGSIAPGVLAKPRDLDIIPYPQRRALLTWVGTEAAKRYRVDITAVGEGLSVVFEEDDPCTTINLDRVFGDRGLANTAEFQFQVTALGEQELEDGTVETTKSQPSETVTLVDNPIVSINGNSKNTQDGKGQAIVRWSEVTGATHYTIMYRELPGDHSMPGWTVVPRAAGPRRGSIRMAASTPEVDRSDPNRILRTYTIGGTRNTDHPLDRDKIYAMYVNYENGSGRYYAAREAYVWPSDRPADDGERVGTFPLTRVLDSIDGTFTFDYLICEDGFSEHLDEWKKLIAHALWQWELASNGLVRFTYVGSDCANYSEVLRQVVDEFGGSWDSTAPVSEEKAIKFLESLDETFHKARTDDLERNEVIMVDLKRYESLGPSGVMLFPEVAFKLGIAMCIVTHSPACVGSASHDATPDGPVTDIYFQRQYFYRLVDPEDSAGPVRLEFSLGIPGTARVDEDGTIRLLSSNARFNTCDSNVSLAYEAVVHEGGHALGIRGGRIPDHTWVESVAGHSTVADSIMNYDARELRDQRFTTESHILRSEPDCTPHPLDILAVYALYEDGV